MTTDDTKELLAAIADAAHDLDGLESGQLLAKAALLIAEQSHEIRTLTTQLSAANDRANNAEHAAKQWEAVAKDGRDASAMLRHIAFENGKAISSGIGFSKTPDTQPPMLGYVP